MTFVGIANQNIFAFMHSNNTLFWSDTALFDEKLFPRCDQPVPPDTTTFEEQDKPDQVTIDIDIENHPHPDIEELPSSSTSETSNDFEGRTDYDTPLE